MKPQPSGVLPPAALPLGAAFSRLAVVSLVALIILAVVSGPACAADPIGKVLFAKGVVSARAADGKMRLMGKEAPLFVGDVLITAADSFAVFEATDGTRVTVRPDSVFGLEDYAHGQGKESFLMRLTKGGIRAVSGMITKLNPDKGFRLQTPTAVVAVRGTQFDARLCQAGDCGPETAGTVPARETATVVAAGRLFQLKGKLMALGSDGVERDLPEGGPVFAGDILETSTDGFALVVFRDDSRVTLQAGSRFTVEHFEFAAEAKKGSAFLRLLKGGMRVLSGAIVKLNPQAMKIGAPTAVLALRGTALDLRHCEGDCPGESGKVQEAPAAARVVQSQGEVTALFQDGTQARLGQGDPVRVGTTLKTSADGSAVVVFRDNSRITLQPDTLFKVEDYRYTAGGDGNFAVRLLKGSLRAVSGLMTRRNPGSFRVFTPTCVLALRGTAFDILDRAQFTDNQLLDMGIDPAALETGGGMIFFVRQDGPLELTNAAGTFTIAQGQAVLFPSLGGPAFPIPQVTDVLTANPYPAPETVPADVGGLFTQADTDGGRLYVSLRDGDVVVVTEDGTEQVIPQGAAVLLAGWQARIEVLSQLPPFLLNIVEPAPEDAAVDIDALFGAASGGRPGLYISVYDGHVVLANSSGELTLGKGEAGFADPQMMLVRLDGLPLFHVNDTIPSPQQLQKYIQLFQSGLKPAAQQPGGQGDCQCEIVY